MQPRTNLSRRQQFARAAESESNRTLILTAIGTAFAVAVIAALISPVVGAVLGCAAICMAQGFWRGAAEIAGLLIGTIAAMILAPGIGRATEGVLAGVLSTGGIAGRLLSTAIVFVLVCMIVWAVVSFIAKRIMKRRPEWKAWDRWLGGGLGMLEGLLLGMALLWIPLAIEPIAHGTLPPFESQGTEPPAQSSGAKRIVVFADLVKRSALGGIAQATNPADGSALLAFAEDFAVVSRNEAALTMFVRSAAMQSIQELPSVVEAKRRLEQDPELRELIRGEGVPTDVLMRIMKSDAVLRVLDETTLLEDLSPRAAEIGAALSEARRSIK